MAKAEFDEKKIPKFADAPSAILIVGGVDFFVEEAAGRAREALGSDEVEVLRFEDDAPSESVSDALLNRSLFSPRRIVELDISRLLGTDSPGRLVTMALDAWSKGGAGGRREAFKHARALLAALDLPSGADPAENAEAAAKRVRKKDDAPLLAEILKELPEEKSGGPAVLKAALRVLLERETNDGTVALLTAVSPPAGVDLLQEISARGLVFETAADDQAGPALRRLAEKLAKDREVAVESSAIDRLLARTDGEPATFSAELGKLLDWAGKGGRIRAADVEANVEDESSEDVYGLFDAIGRRDAGDALQRLERLFDGREVRQGDRDFQKIDDIWHIQLFGMIAERGPAHAAAAGAPRRGGPGRLQRRDALLHVSGARPAAAARAGGALRPLALRRGEGAASSFRTLQGGPARVPVQLPGAGAGARAGGRRGRAAEVLGPARGDDLGDTWGS